MNTNTIQHQLPVNTILNGNCIDKMRQMQKEMEKSMEKLMTQNLALRLRSAGWRSILATDAVGVHLGSATHGHRSAWQRRHGGFGRGYMLRRYGLLRGAAGPRTLGTEALVVLADLAISHDLEALRGRLSGWRAGAQVPRRALPPAEAVDRKISFRDSLALRRGVYGRRAA